MLDKKKYYISYANEDFSMAVKLMETLKKNNVDCSLVNHVAMDSDSDCAVEILQAINKSTDVILVYTRNTEYSVWQSIETIRSFKVEKNIHVFLYSNQKIADKFKMNLANAKIFYCNSISSYVSYLLGGDRNGNNFNSNK